MEAGRGSTLAWESLWGKRAGIAALAGSILALVGFVVLQATISGEANFEGLQEAHDSSATIWLSGLASCVGYVLLAFPLYYLFRAARERSSRIRGQLVGIVILGPLLLGASGLLLSAGTEEAADTYVKGEAKSTLSPKEATKECTEEREDKGAEEFAEDFESKGGGPMAACTAKKSEEDRASNAIKDASFVTAGQLTGLAGGLTLVVALFYTGLWSMRTGLLTRFWGSLGMAVGVAALIGITPLALLWFFYLGMLLIGWVLGGKPPAWAAGEAVPWPTPAEKAAADLEGPSGEPDDAAEPGEPAADPASDPDSGDQGPARKKRKQRD